MPELPEVEIVTRHLRTLLSNRTIIKAQLFLPRLAAANSPRQFAASLRKAKCETVARRGKHILLHFDNAKTLITHLRMTGRFLYIDQKQENPKHTHAQFQLDNGKKLIFVDPRQFGTMHVIATKQVFATKALARLAPEPFEAAFTTAYLYDTLQRSRQPIKLTLLDQTKVLGLGNIYAAEALHRARVHPETPANTIARPRVKILQREIVAVLDEAIANNSTMNMNPEELDGSYSGGVYESMTFVYEREGMPCRTCQTVIQRFTQSGRSTYYCPTCQKL